MRTAFEEKTRTELKGLIILEPYLRQFWVDGMLIPTGHNLVMQKFIGDYIAKLRRLGVVSIEVKVEEKHTGKLFLETFSNRSRKTPGWFYTSRADLLWYYFLDVDKLYSMRLRALQLWAVQKKNLEAYPHLEQRKTAQMNDTWGRTVPIGDIQQALGEDFTGPLCPQSLLSGSQENDC